MSFQVIVLDRANDEIIDAYQWYELQVPNLGEKLLAEIEYVISLILEHPKIFPVARNKYREAPLGRFSYSIIYRIDVNSNAIVVLSLFHHKRSPSKKPR
ncbi:MAG: type II toxin-antitoxin system RelE/ParE family toxin [Bacteroidia bacterium]